MGIDAIVQEGEGPQHDVTITNDFYISGYEATQALFESVMGYNPSVFKGPNLPVETVNWYEAVEFCNKLSEQEGLTPVYDNKTFTMAYDFSALVTSDITLYAKWILDSMVCVPKGSFKMGIDAIVQEGEGPQHDVTLTNDYYISRYEVTQALFESVMGYNPSVFKGPNLPVETVNWYEAVEFCNKLSEQEGLTPVYKLENRKPATGYPITHMKVTVNWNNNGYRLPTEAEWEYAAKGGDGSPGNYTYSGSNNVDSIAWYLGNSGNTTHAVGTKAPNGLGIYDMSGNVWEWCWDQYEKDYYSHSPLSDPRGSGNNTVDNDRTRVMRGGCFSSDDVRPRSVNRWRHIPSYNVDVNGVSEYQGFRIGCQ